MAEDQGRQYGEDDGREHVATAELLSDPGIHRQTLHPVQPRPILSPRQPPAPLLLIKSQATRVDTMISRNCLDTSDGELNEKYERGVNRVNYGDIKIIFDEI